MIDLSLNENLYGPSPRLKNTIKNISLKDLAFYSRNKPGILSKELARRFILNEENIFLGYGVEDLIVKILEKTLSKKDKVLLPDLIWPYYFDILDNLGADIVNFSFHDKKIVFDYNIEEILEKIKSHKPKVIVIASPNNPTGNLFRNKDIKKLLNNYDGILILDQTYFEFNNQEEFDTNLLEEHENLIVLRSFSKYYGLAGLRIGFGLCHSKTKNKLGNLDKYLGMNEILEKIAIEALKHPEYYEETSKQIIKNRRSLIDLINKSEKIKAYESHANFVLVKVMDQNLKKILIEGFRNNNIKIKIFSENRLSNFLRIGIGKKEHMEKVMEIISSANP